MGMSNYYKRALGIPKDETTPPAPEAVTVTKIPEVAEIAFVTEEPEPIVEKEPEPVVIKKKLGAKKKK